MLSARVVNKRRAIETFVPNDLHQSSILSEDYIWIECVSAMRITSARIDFVVFSENDCFHGHNK